MAPNIMTAFFMTVCLTIVWMVIFTVKLESINTGHQNFDSNHNGTVSVQVSNNQQQQDDELRCDCTGCDVQEVRPLRSSKFFGLMKSLLDNTTHRRLPLPPTHASELIWNIRLASGTVVRPAVSGVVAFVDNSIGGSDFGSGLELFNSTGDGLNCSTALNRWGGDPPQPPLLVTLTSLTWGWLNAFSKLVVHIKTLFEKLTHWRLPTPPTFNSTALNRWEGDPPQPPPLNTDFFYLGLACAAFAYACCA